MNFKPEEIEVKITKSLIKIVGKHESQFASRSFSKEITIPYGVKADTIQCTFSEEEGILTISAPIQSALSVLSESLNQQDLQQVTQQQQNVTQQQQKQVTQQQQQQVTQQQQKVTQQQTTQQHKTSVSENTTSIRDSARRMLEEDFILRPIMDLQSLMSPQTSNFDDISSICNTGDGQKFEVKLDVPDYKPEELQIKISNNMVTIEGKQETSFSSKQFYKKFSIPQGVKPETITSSLSPKGVLTLSAPIERTDSSSEVSRKTVTQQQQVVQSNQQVQQQQQQQQQQRTSQQQVTEQQIQQQKQQVIQQVQQLQQQQQTRKEQVQQSDSNSSISSNLSRRLEDFVLRPVIDMDSVLARDTRFEDISKELSQVNDGNKFEVS